MGNKKCKYYTINDSQSEYITRKLYFNRFPYIAQADIKLSGITFTHSL
jgi:hypothetical protein